MESGFDEEESSLKDRPPIVYLELGNHVATVRNEPLDNISLENDAELKSNVQKLMGLIATRRRLYTPEEYCAAELEKLTSTNEYPLNNSTFSPAHPVILASTWSSLNLANPHPPTLEERRAKERNDFLVETDANITEMETPNFLKEIDLSELPSREEVASICGRHKSSIACLERHPHFYRFVESLRPTTPINMCHPLALTYRERSFKSCKEDLAKTLFNIFNHAIFQCGLHAPIVWKSSLRTSCERVAIDASGQRSAYILLWKKISQPEMLVKMLLHEMCHAAAFVFNRETGHGDHCRRWVYQAKRAMPELPTIADCDPHFKYTCTLCARWSYGRIDFGTATTRCHYCQFEVITKPFQKADKHTGTRPDRTLTPFKAFIRDSYLKLDGMENITHSAKMRLLNEEFLKIRVSPG